MIRSAAFALTLSVLALSCFGAGAEDMSGADLTAPPPATGR